MAKTKAKTATRSKSAAKAKPVSRATASRPKTVARRPKGTYVDGFLLPLPKKNRNAYKKMAELGRTVWMEHGALEYRECIGADLAQGAMGTSFTKVSGAKTSDTVVFAWVVYKSKAHRDKVVKKVMTDPRMNPASEKEAKKMKSIFDMTKMAYGGFDILVTD